MTQGVEYTVTYWLKDRTPGDNIAKHKSFSTYQEAINFEEELIIDNAIGLDGDKSRVGLYQDIHVEEINWDEINKFMSKAEEIEYTDEEYEDPKDDFGYWRTGVVVSPFLGGSKEERMAYLFSV